MGAQTQGTVVVQTFQPTEPAIAYACRHDYLGFVQAELPNRKEFGYPPYGRLVRIVLAHKAYAKVHAAADEMVRLIAAITAKQGLSVRVVGPVPPPMERLIEQYRVEIVLFADSAVPLQKTAGGSAGAGGAGVGACGGSDYRGGCGSAAHALAPPGKARAEGRIGNCPRCITAR